MLILIAESKTMTPCNGTVESTVYKARRPAFGDRADDIMLSLRDMDVASLSKKVKISASLAARLREMIYEFPDKVHGSPAIEAFTGVVFRALDYVSMTDAEKERVSGQVRIVSSLYGWLRPDDIIKQYRFDFTTALAPDGRTFIAYWRDILTDCLLHHISENNIKNVVDMMPGDASRCFDWNKVSSVANVRKIEFRELLPGGSFKTPSANRLKTLRGLLLRQIIMQNITSADDLVRLSSDDYLADGNFTFITES